LVAAHLWVKDSTGDWLAMALSRGDVMKLTDAGVYPASISQDEMAMQDHVFILPRHHSREKPWILVAGSLSEKAKEFFSLCEMPFR
jgi:hypothetical protein